MQTAPEVAKYRMQENCGLALSENHSFYKNHVFNIGVVTSFQLEIEKKTLRKRKIMFAAQRATKNLNVVWEFVNTICHMNVITISLR